jgi:hypothetical protein
MRSNLRYAVWIIPALGCQGRQSASPAVAAGQTRPTVFTDSVLHDRLCEPTTGSENWRIVCVPKDQSAPRAVPKNP